MEIISLFSGCGGFKQAGFDIKWHNEFDKHIVPTLKKNFNRDNIDIRDIRVINSKEIPSCFGGGTALSILE
ncbi:MAG: DNA cytosine methyltransferase [Bdellovibrionales bacterium]|nr:DNA cytosine methyltransferase [Bdellovibrionales bacterium]